MSSWTGKFNVEMKSEMRNKTVRMLACGKEEEDDDDEEMKSVAEMIIESVKKCPIDMRREMMRNIVMTGGGSMIGGFGEAVREGIEKRKKREEEKGEGREKQIAIVKPMFPGNIVGWVGAAAMVFSGDGTPKMFSQIRGGSEWIKRTDIESPTFKFPDWSSIGHSFH